MKKFKIVLSFVATAWSLSCPSGVYVSKLESKIHFKWGESWGRVDGYRIYYGTNEGGPYPSLLCDVEDTTLEYITNLEIDKNYYFVCRAYNEVGESEDSNEVHLLKQDTINEKKVSTITK